MSKRRIAWLHMLAGALALVALAATLAGAETGCVVQSCSPASGVAVLASATNVCSLPTYSGSQYAAAGSYSYLTIATLNYTEPATATTIATSNGVGSSGNVTGVASSGVQVDAISTGTWTPSGASAYPSGIGTMTATAGATGGTANTTSVYIFVTCPAYHE